ncbi:spore coat protein U domain-containing protein [Gluconacetobacter sacchari]|uniref:Csu type fimbrial protein n=1 Tax=Gluconacetobacter sacchari TaxID=92759 RepID=UPI0039B64EC9
MKPLVFLTLLLLATLTGGRAWAACSVSTTGTTPLGSLSSLAVSSGGSTTEISSGFSCNGGLLSLIYTQTVNAQIQSIGALTNPAGDSLPMQLCQSANCATTYTAGQTINWSETSLIGLLGLFNGINGTLPLYVRIPPGSYNVSAGVYTGSVTIGWTWNVCWGIGVLGLCAGLDSQTTPVPETIPLTFTITADCRITAPNVVFAPSPLVTAFTDIHQSLTVGCTRGSTYTVGISDGNNADSTSRAMSNGAGSLLRYEIYKQSTTDRWGSTGMQRRADSTADVNPNSLDGITQQQFAYTAHILTTQPTPPAGSYNDNLVVDVQF